jgi:beta-galactosidase
MVKGVMKYFLVACILSVHILYAQVRTIIDFNSGWKFYLGNDSTASNEKYNDASWRVLNLPHDWSIESDFIKDAPATNQGGSLPGGIGWYRKTFTLPASASEKKINIEFDGIYQNSEIWINGHYLGKRPNGYVNFSYELTEYLKPALQKNVIVVKVDNSKQPNSRWYSGSGIYRDVKLVVTKWWYLKHENVFIYNEIFNEKKVALFAQTKLVTKNTDLEIWAEIYDSGGKFISRMSAVKINENNIFSFSYKINNPELWSPTNPVLYRVKFKVFIAARQMDEYETTFGIRSFHFDAQKGFFLNNQSLKIKGVCMHHDLGALGAAFNKAAAKRQLNILKEMGCNAIRFSHNPPAAAMLDLCDEMGFLVIDEAFDMWKKKKNKYDYHNDFTEWHKKDLEAMIYRDRNHPSVIAWSIGNEIREQFDSTGTTITKELVDIVKQIDPTRPAISALTETFPEKNFITKANALDLLGFNYKAYDYAALPQRFPNQKFIATETASALATRGVYQFPSDSIRIWPPDYKAQDTFSNRNGNKDYTTAAYDNTHAYWGGTHEKTWLAVKQNLHMAGIFVWSGFDFLGEPLPYPKFPARSSYYGIVDLAGFPKDVYYMYQSEWTTKPVLHIFPHWNWEKGKLVDVWAYYNNADEVELFVNNKSVGKRNKTDSTLHVMWRIPFEPGTLKAISRKNGKIVLIKEIKTAGKPAKIELIADRQTIKADGKDLSFITARILDKNGHLVPDADNMIEFAVSGAGIIAGTDNGYQADTISFISSKRRAWKGISLAIIKSSGKKGNITVSANAEGLKPSFLQLKTRD